MVDKLELVGLGPNEVKCYRVLLKIGSASANEISRVSGIHRVSVYDALRGLREKGLISQIQKERKLLFEAASPERILDMVQKKEEQLSDVKGIIPSLLTTFGGSKERQEIHSFKGVAGIRNILQDMLGSKTEILDFGAEYKFKEFYPYYANKWQKERHLRKIRMRILANRKLKPLKIPSVSFKYVPSEFNSSVSTFIYDGKVALIMWVNPLIGVLIKHQAVYESYKSYFEYLWKRATE